jgi:hypothetical protein
VDAIAGAATRLADVNDITFCGREYDRAALSPSSAGRATRK